MKKLLAKIGNLYLYSLLVAPFAFVLLMSGDQDYIVNKILTTYFLCVGVLAFVLWPVTTLIEWIRKKAKQ